MTQPEGAAGALSLSERGPTALTGRVLTALFLLAALIAFTQGVAPLLGLTCETCSGGALAVALPWAGVAFYGTLAALAHRRPDSAWLSRLLGLSVFTHGSLMIESVLLRRWCVACVLIALLAVAAGAFQAWRQARDLPAFAVAAILGMGAGFLFPFDRAEVRLIVYEKDCKT